MMVKVNSYDKFVREFCLETVARGYDILSCRPSIPELFILYQDCNQILKVIQDDKSEGYNVEDYIDLEIHVKLADIARRSGSLLAAESPKFDFRDEIYISSTDLSIDEGFRLSARSEAVQLSDFIARIPTSGADTKPTEEVNRYLDSIDETLERIVDFSLWVLNPAQPCSDTYICLLRDGLLPYLALRELSEIHPQRPRVIPLLVSRAFFLPFLAKNNQPEDFDRIPSLLEEPIYSYLLTEGMRNPSVTEMAEYFQRALANFTEAALDDIVCYLGDHLSNNNITMDTVFVESGAQGTIPLLLMHALAQLSHDQKHSCSFRMLTCLPWLRRLYRDIIFTESFQHLRDFETLVCNDKYFFFHSADETGVWVSENNSDPIRSVAQLEISRFMGKLRDRIARGACL